MLSYFNFELRTSCMQCNCFPYKRLSVKPPLAVATAKYFVKSFDTNSTTYFSGKCNHSLVIVITQLTFTCSKSTIETLEKRCQICLKLTYSSTDNFSSPILVSDWLIFRCGNLLLLQNRNEND